jgi:uncharacterized protein (TIGR03067 family)
MKTSISCITVAAFFIGAAQDGDDLIRKEQKRFQGTWKVVAAEQKGEKVPAKDLEGILLTIEGHTIQVKENDKTQERYTYKLALDKKPKQVDFTYKEGPKKGRTDRGIYKFERDGERLTFCIEEDEKVTRPRDFATNADSSLSLVVLERVK